jgi:hypothetical protein
VAICATARIHSGSSAGMPGIGDASSVLIAASSAATSVGHAVRLRSLGPRSVVDVERGPFDSLRPEPSAAAHSQVSIVASSSREPPS